MNRLLLRLKAKLSFAPIVILIEEGRTKKIRGAVSLSLLHEFSQVSKDKEIRNGLITIIKDRQGFVLNFSGSFDKATQQRFRNVWFSQPVRKMMKV